MSDGLWWNFEDIKNVFFANSQKSVSYKDFLLANIDWAEWPGGAAEIESAYNTQRSRVRQLEKTLTANGIEIPSWDSMEEDEDN